MDTPPQARYYPRQALPLQPDVAVDVGRAVEAWSPVMPRYRQET